MKRTLRWLRWLAIAACIVAILYVRFSRSDYAFRAQQRADAAEAMAESPPDEPEPIEVAIVWPREGSDSFLRGIHLAEAEIENAGGIQQTADDGREYKRILRIRYFDERSPRAGVAIAQQIAGDPDILAVVGHNTESIMQSSVVYQKSGVLLLAPTNMDRRVTLHGFENVFRTAPRYRQVAQAMVESVSAILGKKQIRLAVLFPSAMYPSHIDPSSPAEAEANQAPDRRRQEDLELAEREKKQAVVRDRLERHANRIIARYGDKVDFRVVFTQQYERGQPDSRVIESIIQWQQLYDTLLIMDVSPDASNLRIRLNDRFVYAQRDPDFEKPTLDLNSLDWSDSPALYAKPSEELDPERNDWLFEQAAGLVLRETRKKIVILASRDSYGTSLGAEIRSSVAATHDDPVSPLNLQMYRAYRTNAESYLPLVAEVLQEKPDFVLLAGVGRGAVEVVRQLRSAGMDRPIICGPDLEYELIVDKKPDPLLARFYPVIDDWLNNRQPDGDLHSKDKGLGEDDDGDDKESGKPKNAAQMFESLRKKGYVGSEAAVRAYLAERQGGTYVASVFDSSSARPKVTDFVARFKSLYGFSDVDALAAQGYQAIYLLRDAFQRGGSTAPQTTAAALRLFVEDEGIFGRNRFSDNGDLLGLEIVFKQRSPGGDVNILRLNDTGPVQPAR